MPASKLTPVERQFLGHAVAHGGGYTIKDLSPSEMLQAAGAVSDLKSRGLLKVRIRFAREMPGQPEAIAVEITAAGRRALDCAP